MIKVETDLERAPENEVAEAPENEAAEAPEVEAGEPADPGEQDPTTPTTGENNGQHEGQEAGDHHDSASATAAPAATTDGSDAGVDQERRHRAPSVTDARGVNERRGHRRHGRHGSRVELRSLERNPDGGPSRGAPGRYRRAPWISPRRTMSLPGGAGSSGGGWD